MLKSKSLSTHMSTACRWCRANPEKFTVFIERGGIETTGETPTFVYNYRLVMFVMDYTRYRRRRVHDEIAALRT